MRPRSLIVLSAAVSVLLLAGCSSSPDTESSPTAVPAVDLCEAQAASGAASESVQVEGEFGKPSTATFTTPLEIDVLQSTVIAEGTGTPVENGDYVSFALTAFDADTGEELGSMGYPGTDAVSPQQISSENPLGQLLGCAAPGTRVVAAFPATDSGPGEVYVVDLLDATPAAQWCAATEPGDAFPTVDFSAEGVPTVTIPDAAAPEGVQLEVLEEGDGDVVEAGDSVTVHYSGVKWSDGTVFDSSFERGEPSTFATTGVVTGFRRALEGQTVGSTVVVTMSPACGYGEGELNSSDLVGETLVFVVEIRETAAAQ